MATHESYGIAQHRYKITNVETAEPVGTPVSNTPSSSNTNHIPDWCKNLFENPQKNPDEAPGVQVTMIVNDKKESPLMRGTFMYYGQDHERLTGVCDGFGKVHSCTVIAKGRTIKAIHDMQDMIVDKGNVFEINLRGLKMLDLLT